MGEFVQGMTTDYSNLYGGSLGTDTERKMEQKLNGVVEKMLNDADHECEKLFVNHKGILEYTYVVRIPKEDLKKEMINVLSEDKKLGIDFKESQMQEFIDQRMEKMQEAKKNAGY